MAGPVPVAWATLYDIKQSVKDYGNYVRAALMNPANPPDLWKDADGILYTDQYCRDMHDIEFNIAYVKKAVIQFANTEDEMMLSLASSTMVKLLRQKTRLQAVARAGPSDE